MAFEPPKPPDGIENQPASPIATSESFLDATVAEGDSPAFETAKILSEDILRALAERMRIYNTDQISLPSEEHFVVTTATPHASSTELGKFLGGPGPTNIEEDQLLLPDGVCNLPGEPVKKHGRLLQPSEEIAQYGNYVEIHVQPLQPRPSSVGDLGLITSERRQPTDVRNVGINPTHIGNRLPGPDHMAVEESLPIFRAIGCIFAASPEEDTFPRPVLDADVDLGEIQHVPVFEEGRVGRIPDVVSHITSFGDNGVTDKSNNSGSDTRLWFHFMQRTPEAESLNAEEIRELHQSVQGVSNSTKGFRRCFRGAVVEGLVPITP